MHARLTWRGNAAVIEGIDGATVVINGAAGATTLLRVGDAIRLGGGTSAVELRVVRDLGAARVGLVAGPRRTGESLASGGEALDGRCDEPPG